MLSQAITPMQDQLTHGIGNPLSLSAIILHHKAMLKARMQPGEMHRDTTVDQCIDLATTIICYSLSGIITHGYATLVKRT